MNNNFHVGWCPFCNEGWIDILKDSSNNTLLLLCDECDTTWRNPADIKLNKPIIDEPVNKLIMPSMEEITNIGWDKLIISTANSA